MALRPIDFSIPILPRREPSLIEQAIQAAIPTLVDLPFAPARERRAEQREIRREERAEDRLIAAEKRNIENNVELTRRLDEQTLRNKVASGELRTLDSVQRGAFIAEGLNPDIGVVVDGRTYHPLAAIKSVEDLRKPTPELEPIFQRIYRGVGIPEERLPFTPAGREFPVSEIPVTPFQSVPTRDPLLAGEAQRLGATLPLAIDVQQLEEQARARREATAQRRASDYSDIYRNVDISKFWNWRIKDSADAEARKLTFDEATALTNLGVIRGSANSPDLNVRTEAQRLLQIADRLNLADQQGLITQIAGIDNTLVEKEVASLAEPSALNERRLYANELGSYDLLRTPEGRVPTDEGQADNAFISNGELARAMVILRRGPFADANDIAAAEQAGSIRLSPRIKGWISAILYKQYDGRVPYHIPGADIPPDVAQRIGYGTKSATPGTAVPGATAPAPAPGQAPAAPSIDPRTGFPRLVEPTRAPGTTTVPAPASATGVGAAPAPANIFGSDSYRGLYGTYSILISADPALYDSLSNEYSQVFTDPETAANYLRASGLPESQLAGLTRGDTAQRRVFMQDLQRRIMFALRQARDDALAASVK